MRSQKQLDAAARDFQTHVLENFAQAEAKSGYDLSAISRLIKKHGAVQIARMLVDPTEDNAPGGFHILLGLGLEQHSIERTMLDFADSGLFENYEIDAARKRLATHFRPDRRGVAMTKDGKQPIIKERGALRRAPDQRAIRVAYSEFFLGFASDWHSLTAGTLTLKQGRSAPNGGIIAITVEDCRRTAREFGRALDRRYFGRSARRFGRSLKKIFALERGAGGRWHYHVAIEPPPDVAPSEFHAAIRECWTATDWGHHEIKIEPNADLGWVSYCLKPATKDALDFWTDGIELVGVGHHGR